MTPEQLAELFVEDTGDNITGIATDIEILLKQAYKSGYKCAVDMIANHLLCIELSNFFPTLDEDEEIAKGRKKLIQYIRKAMEE